MSMNSQQMEALANAMDKYAYPKILFDFKNRREMRYSSMRQLEANIRRDLKSGNPNDAKRGLSNVLHWGFYSSGLSVVHMNKFNDNVTYEQLALAARTLAIVRGPGLLELKNIKLPQFSNMCFLSKVRMFLDPTRWVVLDRSLMTLAAFEIQPFCNIKEYETYLPCTRLNQEHYAGWSKMCRQVVQLIIGVKTAWP